jgi:hypothetical protein
MDRADQPAKIDFVHDVAYGGESFSNRGLIVVGHCEARRKLNQETDQSNAAQTIKDVDVGWDVLACNIVRKCLDFQALLKPVVYLTHETAVLLQKIAFRF